ncbi:hypothetical protein NYZ65_06260 [Acinetobacter baumannii]|nr:hypothetical protein [Acinetobacter baumannii]
MHSTLDVKSHKKMTAEEILEEIEYPLENLQNLLFAFSKMKVDDGLKEQEFSAIINTLHHLRCCNLHKYCGLLFLNFVLGSLSHE